MRWLRLWAAIAVALVGFSVSVGGAVAAPSWSSTFEFASGGSEPSVAIDAAGNAAAGHRHRPEPAPALTEAAARLQIAAGVSVRE
jgi:hypothetical protein